ncbi:MULTISPECIES: ATP-grasp fold amidoligase family protein [unclassified Devosia]|uniref:ATP-grasp fold amidoligase family protein n=1 Tax=unclassified Devosia TaxID=196773 RepID=UPI0008697DE8|nr:MULTISPECIES: ATP-grasp fold amidoligase family protein [unclassified Devosia]MBN9362951.1 hypothetical protein [Devosia sp.]ODS81415.1 MAG: hypothetical protein ABS47_24425 [Devosia sp. SCN 66-27]OJX23531.1 MAG: hypothetical protein BGO83_01265 [Devosia sp. 66-14]
MTSRADQWILRAADAWVRLSNRRLVRACRRHFGYVPDFARPRGHDALMQWRKAFDHNPLFVTFCDKLAAREWARARVPDLGMSELVWSGPSLDLLPAGLPTDDQVLKVNSGTGSNYFPGRGHWDDATLRRRFRHWLRWPQRGPGEWAYDQVSRRLMVERLIASPADLTDLTFRCQDGEIASAFIGVSWKTAAAYGCYLTADGAAFRAEEAPVARQLLRRELFERAASIARELGRGLDHVRVDFYLNGDDIYFGELTAYSSSGLGEEEEVGVGPLIERSWLAAIEKSWFLSTPQPWPMSLYQGAFRRWVTERRGELASAPAAAPAPPGPAP